jgi:hypothetical protein
LDWLSHRTQYSSPAKFARFFARTKSSDALTLLPGQWKARSKWISRRPQS